MNELDGLSLPALLDRLADLSVPAPVSLLPATAAWGWLGGLLFALAMLLAVRLGRRARARAYRRAALRAVRAALRVGDPTAQARALAALLRRTALAAFPREQVAALQGEAWLRFLDLRQGRRAFDSELGRCLVAAPYMEDPRITAEQAAALARMVRSWIRRHRA